MMAEKFYDPIPEQILNQAVAELKQALGEEWVSDDPVTCICYSRDQSMVRAKKPNIVALPAGTAEVQKVIRIARRYQLPVQPYSTGINSYGGCIPERAGILLDLRRMNQVLEVDAENMVMRVQPFVTFGWGQCIGEKLGMRLINPTAPPTPSILANFLDKGVGLSSTKYGMGPEHILSMTIVDADGEIIKTGCDAYPGLGHVNLPGPGPDLSGIYEASLGVFGICTEMVVQLYHWPQHEIFTALTSEDEDLEGILKIMQALVREDITEEMFLFQDGYFAIGGAENNEGTEIMRKYMPKNSIIFYLMGKDEEELAIKKRQLDRFVERTGATFVKQSFMDLFNEALDARRCLKITQQTPRAERLRGSFLIMWFNTTFEQLPHLTRLYRNLLREAVADSDPRAAKDPFPKESPAVYVQPMEFGRTIGVEFDIFWSPDDPESVKRTFPVGPAVTNMILDHGGWYERTSRAGILQSPRLPVWFPVLKEIKQTLDPLNILNPGRMGLP
jgi:FAD/FMN-containing dehydrogenase